ncbi:hypothetical protein [Nocardia sp. NPDC057227]|uniref:hypothetical protein n=1 Tax=Nocardia sp. NPDC057227 TaxID=3346056 RepID=UPI00363D3271
MTDPWAQLAEHADLLRKLATTPERVAPIDRAQALDALAKLADEIRADAKRCRRSTLVEAVDSGLSQSEIARRWGVSPQRVNNLLSTPVD